MAPKENNEINKLEYLKNLKEWEDWQIDFMITRIKIAIKKTKEEQAKKIFQEFRSYKCQGIIFDTLEKKYCEVK